MPSVSLRWERLRPGTGARREPSCLGPRPLSVTLWSLLTPEREPVGRAWRVLPVRCQRSFLPGGATLHGWSESGLPPPPSPADMGCSPVFLGFSPTLGADGLSAHAQRPWLSPRLSVHPRGDLLRLTGPLAPAVSAAQEPARDPAGPSLGAPRWWRGGGGRVLTGRLLREDLLRAPSRAAGLLLCHRRTDPLSRRLSQAALCSCSQLEATQPRPCLP